MGAGTSRSRSNPGDIGSTRMNPTKAPTGRYWSTASIGWRAYHLRAVACVAVLAWPARAHAEIGGELLAAFSWLVLVPLGVIQVVVAATMRGHVNRSWVGLTALAAVVSGGIGAA